MNDNFEFMSDEELREMEKNFGFDICLNDEERQLMKEPIRLWGQKWQEWIRDFYPTEYEILRGNGRFWVIPRIIDKEAAEMRNNLSETYDNAYYHTRPDGSDTLAVIRWETEKGNYIDHQISSNVVYGRTRVDE